MCRNCVYRHYCKCGDIEAVSNMMRSESGLSPEHGLSIACKYRHFELAKMLITQYGAMVCDIHVTQACNAENFDIAAMLIQHGGNCEHLSYEHTKAILNLGQICQNQYYEQLTHKKRIVSKIIDNDIARQFNLFDLNIIPTICNYVEYG